jgi:hypothetical protein
MINIFALLVILNLTIIHGHAGKPHASSEPQGTDIKIMIQPIKPSYKTGESINLRVILENQGKATLFVGQTLRRVDWIYSVRITVSDEKGRFSPEMHLNHPFMLDYDSSQSFISALTASWIALPPGYMFGTTIRIDGTDFEFLKKPGRYMIEAEYVSYGMEEPLNYNRLAASPEDIKKLPYPSWRGQTKSEPTWINIVQN